MTTCQEFPEMRISTDSNDSHDGVLELLLAIKPNWNKEEIQIEILSGGYSSNIFRCFCKSSPEDAVTVRVRRLLSNSPNCNPEFEVKALKEISRMGHFPPLLAIFGNGYCYQYLKGGPLFKLDNQEPVTFSVDMIKLVARRLAGVHSVVVPGADYTSSNFFVTLTALLANDKLAWKDEWPPQKVLVQEVDVIKEYACAEPSSMVLCHGDLHAGNMVWDKEQGLITFVDWELVYIGHRATDIACFVNVLEFLDYLSGVPHEPIPDLERLFCQYYLECVNEIQRGGDSTQQVAAEDLQKLLAEVKRFKLVVVFQCLMCMVAFQETTERLGSDTARLVNYNIDRYLNAKEEAFGFRRFGR